jgi:hypothetical protein
MKYCNKVCTFGHSKRPRSGLLQTDKDDADWALKVPNGVK